MSTAVTSRSAVPADAVIGLCLHGRLAGCVLLWRQDDAVSQVQGVPLSS